MVSSPEPCWGSSPEVEREPKQEQQLELALLVQHLVILPVVVEQLLEQGLVEELQWERTPE